MLKEELLKVIELMDEEMVERFLADWYQAYYEYGSDLKGEVLEALARLADKCW